MLARQQIGLMAPILPNLKKALEASKKAAAAAAAKKQKEAKQAKARSLTGINLGHVAKKACKNHVSIGKKGTSNKSRRVQTSDDCEGYEDNRRQLESQIGDESIDSRKDEDEEDSNSGSEDSDDDLSLIHI